MVDVLSWIWNPKFLQIFGIRKHLLAVPNPPAQKRLDFTIPKNDFSKNERWSCLKGASITVQMDQKSEDPGTAGDLRKSTPPEGS